MSKMTLTIKQLVENNVNIFDFNYPMFDEDFKLVFEELFINHFYFEEISVEAPARFIHNLKTKLNLIMPYWNKVYIAQNLEQRILDNYDVTETYSRDIENTGTGTTTGTNRNLFKDAPKTKVDIERVDNVNSISKDITDSNTSSNNVQTEYWERKMIGNIGVQTDAYAVTQYIGSLVNVTYEIFETELAELFLGIYL